MLLPDVALEGRTVTADALHTHPDTAGLIMDRGGEYLLQIKGNQPSMHKQAKRIMAKSSPLLPA